MKVSDAMTQRVQLCNPDDTLKSRAGHGGARRGLPVTDNDRLVA